MSYQLAPDLQAEVNRHLATGHYTSEDEVLRAALDALAEQAEDLEAVRKAIAEWQAGDSGVPLAEVFQAIRKEMPTGSAP